MKETIYTIPINEAFDRYDGCPMCELFRNLDRSSLDYIMGAAMMEPDVRMETNRLGFCRRHLQTMLEEKNKLSLALMLESHLPELDKAVFRNPAKAASHKPAPWRLLLAPGRRRDAFGETARKATASCFVCGRVSLFMGHYYENMLYMWRKEPDFREKFSRQPFFCLPHYADSLAAAEKHLPEKLQHEFAREISKICNAYLAGLSGDISGFCKSFDYRFAGKGLGDGAATSVERAVAFLGGKL